MEAYCFRCKCKKEMTNPTESRMRNGKACATGTCVTCGTKLFKILPSLPVSEPDTGGKTTPQ